MKIKTAGFSLTAGLFFLGVIIISLISMSLSRTNAIKNIWLEFEVGRSERLSSIISLRGEMGYDGMIHHFKNYLLRQQDSNADAVVSSIGAARAAIEKYSSLQLTSTEKRALTQIEDVINAYGAALLEVSSFIQQGKSTVEIDKEVQIDDTFALQALITLEAETFFIDDEHIGEKSRALLLSGLRTAMGYGGLIHNFKNYVLRYSDESRIQVNNKVKDIEALIEMYESYDIEPIERNALSKVLQVARIYQQKLTTVQEMASQGRTPREVDTAVFVDDTLALDGFYDLQRQLVMRNGVNSLLLKENVETVYSFGQIILYVSLFSFAVFIALAVWLLRYQIILPLTGLNFVMSRLSKNELEVEIQHLKSNTEVGEMARSVEIFKRNAIEKQAGELDLKEANEQLEAKVEERTEELRNNEEKLRSLVETAADAIITADEKGFIQSFNVAAIMMFGYTRNEIVGCNVNALMSGEYKHHHDSFLLNYEKTGQKKIMGVGREVDAKRKDGSVFPIDLSVSEIKDATGGKIFTAIIRDVTEKNAKDLELQLSMEKTERASKAKSEFLSRVTHELRTPMNAIIGFSDLLVSDPDDPLKKEHLESVSYIKESAEQLLELIEGVLDLSEIETGYAEVFIEPVNINNLISQVLKVLEPQIDKELIKVVPLDDESIEVKADYQRLKQVLLSLVSNAVTFSSDQGQVLVSCDRVANNRFRISVSDAGDGAPESLLVTMFEPFNWIDKSNAGISGTGVGLTICKELVELMDGEIGVFNNPYKGLTFWMEFDEA